MFKNVVIIGTSRGLGKALALFIKEHLSEAETLTLVSRKTEQVFEYQNKLQGQFKEIKIIKADMSLASEVTSLEDEIKRNDLVIYCAGGGPYGMFSQKNWKDHAWAVHVGLIAPMQLCHSWLNVKKDSLSKFIIVGSRIAESAPDYNATSYAASKHGLLGFVSSLQPELEKENSKVWLFSPGYIDTQMLPANAKVRQNGSKIMSVETAAQALLRWVKKDGPWHRVLN